LSQRCLWGHPVPGSLEVLWDRHQKRDRALGALFGIERLLVDLNPLDDGYGDAIASESEDIAFNVRAHRTMFEQLGFFAAIEDGAFLAYWLRADLPEPPVVQLDSEGTYRWQGGTAAEALFRIAEERDDGDAARTWLATRGLALGTVGELGTSTQFLPDLDDLHARTYYQNRGEPRPTPVEAAAPADARAPETWLLRPGSEVKDAITKLLGAPPAEFCAWCNGDGLVKQILLGREMPAGVTVLGIPIGATRTHVEKQLGKPAKKRAGWTMYEREGRTYIYYTDEKKIVTSICLGLPDVD